MSKTYTLKAETRERVGKGSSRALRRNGLIPAVIYGDKQEPLPIAVSYKDIFYKIHGGGFLTHIATIELGKQKINVLPKDYQLDPVRDFPMHVDFLRVSEKSMVNVNLPVHFLNEDAAPGIKRGGILNIVSHEIECLVPASAIPDAINVDLTGCDIGSTIHLADIQLPKNVTAVTTEQDFTIATISAPSTGATETEASEEAAEEEEK